MGAEQVCLGAQKAPVPAGEMGNGRNSQMLLDQASHGNGIDAQVAHGAVLDIDPVQGRIAPGAPDGLVRQHPFDWPEFRRCQ